MSDLAPIDWPQLKKRCLDDAEFVREMLAVFRTHTTQTLDKLRLAVTTGDPAAARKHAHTLKGSAANLAAEPLRAAALAIEMAAKDGDPAKVHALLLSVEHEMTRCLAEIDHAPAA